ncbi:6-carboxytetrahydropterin synthase QueD [Pelotomaculum propionicicum]|uniref:6-carboxytetrahydropterin synthase QueD n=1 Tax=Pelotomaculum propionicicum TaxID=258475 RepID=UPI003B7E45A8
MYEITVRTRFAAAHYLKDYDGPCARLHGHTWHIEATFRGNMLDSKGMLLDFGEVKRKIKAIVDELDHNTLNEVEPFCGSSENNPTVENLARYIYYRLKGQGDGHDQAAKISRVRVWESPDTSATYAEV